MKKQTIPICFDLDHTLLDTLQIRKDIFSLARPYGAGTALLRQAHRDSVGARFTPRKFVDFLGFSKHNQAELLKKIWILLSDTRRRYVYPGVSKLLTRLGKIVPLYLVTHGDALYQRIKLQQSGLSHYFSDVIITPQIGKEKILWKLYRQTHGRILLIDDSRRVRETASRIGFPIIKVRKSYKDGRYFEKLYKRILEKIDTI